MSDRRDTRQYPARPMVGVGAVIVDAGKVVLVRRRYEPLAGRWTLPGGMLELGEALEDGAAREVLEETGLQVEVGPMVETFDRIMLDDERRVQYHFVLVDYLCRPVGGALQAGSDVDDAVLVAPDAVGGYNLTEKASTVIARGLALAASSPW
ncbi:MAG: NUDIX hydrolase [Acidobacteria bacterium]|nr:NUDIX hydrolase [Acidobacteriota bacterium]